MKTPHLSDLFGTRPHDLAPSNDNGRDKKYLRAGFYLNRPIQCNEGLMVLETNAKFNLF